MGILWTKTSRFFFPTRLPFQYKDHLSRYGNFHYKDRHSCVYLIFITWITILSRWHSLYWNIIQAIKIRTGFQGSDQNSPGLRVSKWMKPSLRSIRWMVWQEICGNLWKGEQDHANVPFQLISEGEKFRYDADIQSQPWNRLLFPVAFLCMESSAFHINPPNICCKVFTFFPMVFIDHSTCSNKCWVRPMRPKCLTTMS